MKASPLRGIYLAQLAYIFNIIRISFFWNVGITMFLNVVMQLRIPETIYRYTVKSLDLCAEGQGEPKNFLMGQVVTK
jgi:hypothetical protein